MIVRSCLWISSYRAIPKLVKQSKPSVRNVASLAEVGQFCPMLVDGSYTTGQLFLHKVFGYRGVVLTPWKANLHDRDTSVASNDVDTPSFNAPSGNSRSTQYYQVLMDERDSPYVSNRIQTKAVTYLTSGTNSRTPSVLQNMDYVPHDDILPYAASGSSPINHELFIKFFDRKNDSFISNEMFKVWQEKNSNWMEMTDVFRETTEGVRITVIPFYMGQKDDVYWWRYSLRLENCGHSTVQLKERNWRIFSLGGNLETLRGRGVIGVEPILSQQQPAFQYSSHVSLTDPTGHMWGTFKMERDDGSAFEVRIPPFMLESKDDDPNDYTIVGI